MSGLGTSRWGWVRGPEEEEEEEQGVGL